MRNERFTCRLAAVCLLGTLVAASSPGSSTVTVFTNRAAWEDAVAGVATETFEASARGNFPTPYALPGGSLATSLSSEPVLIQVFADGILGSQELHFRDFAGGVGFTLPGNGSAFGFDYHASENWVVEAAGRSTTLPGSTSGFIGYVDDAGPILAFTLRGATGAQGGISLDNLSRIGTSFGGLSHRALGQARIARGAGGELVVTNVGPSGNDGVRVHLGEVEAFTTKVTLRPGETPVGAVMESRFRGPVNGVDRPAGRLGLRRTAEGYAAIVDFAALGSPTYGVTFYDRAGRLVFSQTGLSGEAVQMEAPLIDVDLECKTTTTTTTEGNTTTTSTERSWKLTVDVDWEVLGSLFRASSVLFSLEAPGGGGTAPRRVTGVDIVGSGMPAFQIAGEAVQVLGVDHSTLGNSTFEPASNSLTVANLGSSGQDGVSIDLGQAQSAGFGLAPVDQAGPIPDGAYLLANATGTVGGVPGQSLGDFRITKTADGLDVTADFSAISAPTQRVQVFQDGQLVADFPNHTGRAARASSWPVNLGKLGGATECYAGRFRDGTTFEIDNVVFTGDELRVLAEGSGPAIESKSSFSFRTAGIPELTLTDAAVGTDCVPGPTHLCLNGGRFKVETAWRTTGGQQGTGQAVALTPDTGYFWFFDAANVEMIVKVLDACSFNQRFWVFAGGLTDVQVELTVTDTGTGQVRTYTNPLGTAFQPIQDTGAFATCTSAAPGPARSLESVSADLEPFPAAATDILLNDSRFRVEVEWETSGGQTGRGEAVLLTGDTGYFWFFDAANVELVVKVLNGCVLNNTYWVFAGGLTDVKTRITVTDTQTGTQKIYDNPQGTPFQPLQDTSAFRTCP